MAVATSTAILMAAGAGAGLGYLQNREARKAAEAAGRPTTYSDTSTLTPYGPTLPILTSILGQIDPTLASGLLGLEGLEFPEFVGFPSFSPTHVPGASGTSRGILQDILDLIEEGSPFLEEAEERLPQLTEGLENRDIIELLLALGGQGLLPETVAGKYLEQGNPFEEQVIGSLSEDISREMERRFAEIESAAAGLGRSGSPQFEGEQKSRAREDLERLFADRAGQLRMSNYQTERGLQQQAAGMQGSIFGAAGQLDLSRLGLLERALALVPSLEAARFLGPELAAGTSLNIDQLEQAAANAMAQQNMFGTSLGAQEATALNAHNLAELGFDRQQLFDPFLMLGSALDLTMPIATAFGTQSRSGTSQGPAPYTPSGWSSALTGVLGMLALAGSLRGAGIFGGGGNNPSSIPFNPYINYTGPRYT